MALSEYRNAELTAVGASGAYAVHVTSLEIDADGAPNAYHPDGSSGLDDLRNAGYPDGRWRNVLVADPAAPHRPYVQDSGAYAGFFVSRTALEDGRQPSTDPRRYVDAATFPYMVFPSDMYRVKGTGNLGDYMIALALANGTDCSGIVADIGPAGALPGEVSISLASTLAGRPVAARSGAGKPGGTFIFVVFPGSRTNPPWPVSRSKMDERVRGLLAQLGGWPAIRAALDL